MSSECTEPLLSEHERDEEEDVERPSVGLVRNRRTSMEARSEHQKMRIYNSFYTFTTSVGVGVIALIVFWLLNYRGGFAWESDPAHEFNWHPLCMFISLVFLFSQAMLVFRTGRTVAKPKLKYLHGGLHATAFVLLVIGLKAVFDSHNLATPPVANMYTMHSWLGLTTVIVYATQLVVGFVSFLYPGLPVSYRKIVMDFHVPIGVVCFATALVTTVSGLTEKALWTLQTTYANLPPEGLVFNFLALFTIIYGMLVLYLIFEPSFKRNALPEDHMTEYKKKKRHIWAAAGIVIYVTSPESYTLPESASSGSSDDADDVRIYNIIYIVATSLGVVIFGVLMFWIITYRGGFAWRDDVSKEFNVHPLCMYLGMIFCFSQSILMFRTGRDLKRRTLRYIHGVFHTAAILLGAIGLLAVFDTHNFKSIPNMYSIHSWVGIGVFVVYGTQIIVGFVTFIYPTVSTANQRAVLKFHLPIGLTCFCTAVGNMLTGLTEKALFAIGDDYENFSTEGIIVNCLGIGIVIYGMLVLYLAYDTTYKRHLLVEDFA